MKAAMVGNELPETFKKNPVLQGVHVHGESGTIFALLSSNGAGKTTMVKLLTLRSSRKGDAS